MGFHRDVQAWVCVCRCVCARACTTSCTSRGGGIPIDLRASAATMCPAGWELPSFVEACTLHGDQRMDTPSSPALGLQKGLDLVTSALCP